MRTDKRTYTVKQLVELRDRDILKTNHEYQTGTDLETPSAKEVN